MEDARDAHEALEELRRGEGRTFADVESAIQWLLDGSADEDEDLADILTACSCGRTRIGLSTADTRIPNPYCAEHTHEAAIDAISPAV